MFFRCGGLHKNYTAFAPGLLYLGASECWPGTAAQEPRSTETLTRRRRRIPDGTSAHRDPRDILTPWTEYHDTVPSAVPIQTRLESAPSEARAQNSSGLLRKIAASREARQFAPESWNRSAPLQQRQREILECIPGRRVRRPSVPSQLQGPLPPPDPTTNAVRERWFRRRVNQCAAHSSRGPLDRRCTRESAVKAAIAPLATLANLRSLPPQ